MSCRPLDQVVEAVVNASSWSFENFWKSSSVGGLAVIVELLALRRFRIRKRAEPRSPEYVHRKMKVKPVLLRCSKISWTSTKRGHRDQGKIISFNPLC